MQIGELLGAIGTSSWRVETDALAACPHEQLHIEVILACSLALYKPLYLKPQTRLRELIGELLDGNR